MAESALPAINNKDQKVGITRIVQSIRDGELVAIIGTGVSLSLTNSKFPALSWRGLIESGFDYGVQKGKITSSQKVSWHSQLSSQDLDELLSAAEFIGRKLGAPDSDAYARWLNSAFKDVGPANNNMKKAVQALNNARVPICTLNYDTLLENVLNAQTITLSDTARVTSWMRKENPGIFHLHGSWEVPSSCILGIRDYDSTIRDDVRLLIQRSLGSLRRLLFIGCGGTFADPNFSALISWLRKHIKTAAPEHYALVLDNEVAARHVDPSWEGFVEPLAYGDSRAKLAGFLLKHTPESASVPVKSHSRPARTASPASIHTKVLQDYRDFLLKDCGQMTIEGVHAGMDIAQRKFELERLFVPLKVLPSPPDIPETHPERERLLIEWKEKNKTAIPFGRIFSKRRHIALLALPGGGKTLLLKRLAVAYADPKRRQASLDELPNLDLTPVMLRCREWREHIDRPIPVILQNIPDITSQANLTGLHEALAPLFKSGRVLLLVDGLDEIHNDALRTLFVEHLESFLGDHKRTRVVVTSREAGFGLVAPNLARFCERWKVAPLERDAVISLCDHWQRLMDGDSPESRAEGKRVAESLFQNESLRRLAENPLLLTMLLVVKRGGLPPDRVTLYGRAVEVLLDTWNIKGHEPLNVKEAVPQLAYVAFALMRKGQQTATEKEILVLLDEARELPQIRRYAKDTPQHFFRRVELRSSLLVEVGLQTEGTSTVPFYQFRHLTFQEYLAALAAVEGDYQEYDKTDTVLTPLQPYLTAEKWKEVIPMSAVLAKKQGEVLMGALVADGNSLRRSLEDDKPFPGKDSWLSYPPTLPSSVARLLQCLIEEAEPATETLTSTLQLIALFARGCASTYDWRALSRGPYGEELWHQAWLLYCPLNWPYDAWVRSTCASLAAHQLPDNLGDRQKELGQLLQSEHDEDVGRGLLACSGVLWNENTSESKVNPGELPTESIEQHICDANPAVQNVAIWAWAFFRNSYETSTHPSVKILDHPSVKILDQLLQVWLGASGKDLTGMAGFALTTCGSLPRGTWTPVLSEDQVLKIREGTFDDERYSDLTAACMVAFHSGQVWSDEEIVRKLVDLPGRSGRLGSRVELLQQLGRAGKKYLKLFEREHGIWVKKNPGQRQSPS